MPRALGGRGDLRGTRPTGVAAFRLADLVRDADLLPRVHALGERIAEQAPQLGARIVARWVGGAARYASA
jgi:ATP-dependent DNA helicase RecG